MHPATRASASKDQDKVSAAAALSCPPSEDRTRQEFKGECDTVTILKRHGGLPPARMMPAGFNDFDLDLQSAMLATREVHNAYHNLPNFVRERYPNPKALLDAASSGQLDLSQPASDEGGVVQPPSGEAAASPEGAR